MEDDLQISNGPNIAETKRDGSALTAQETRIALTAQETPKMTPQDLMDLVEDDLGIRISNEPITSVTSKTRQAGKQESLERPKKYPKFAERTRQDHKDICADMRYAKLN